MNTKKEGAAFRCPFSHLPELCLDLVLSFDQVWLGIVRPIVGLGSDCITPSWLWFALPAWSSTSIFTNWASDTGIDLSWKNRPSNATGDATTVRDNPTLGHGVRTLSKPPESSQLLIASNDGNLTDNLTTGAERLIHTSLLEGLNRHVVARLKRTNLIEIGHVIEKDREVIHRTTACTPLIVG